MDVNGISDELKAKALACKSKDELQALAAAEGLELTDEQLVAISDGWNGEISDDDNPIGICPSFMKP